jgi:hypothetical protein
MNDTCVYQEGLLRKKSRERCCLDFCEKLINLQGRPLVAAVGFMLGAVLGFMAIGLFDNSPYTTMQEMYKPVLAGGLIGVLVALLWPGVLYTIVELFSGTDDPPFD